MALRFLPWNIICLLNMGKDKIIALLGHMKIAYLSNEEKVNLGIMENPETIPVTEDEFTPFKEELPPQINLG